jgi:hypothetical protein
MLVTMFLESPIRAIMAQIWLCMKVAQKAREHCPMTALWCFLLLCPINMDIVLVVVMRQSKDIGYSFYLILIGSY